MLFNINRSVFVLGWLGLWSVVIVAVGLSTSATAGTARADTDKTVHAPEVYLIGESSTYTVDDTTITVEPGVLVLYN